MFQKQRSSSTAVVVRVTQVARLGTVCGLLQPRGSKPENILFLSTCLANAFVSQLVIGVLIDNIRQQTGTALYNNQRT